MKDFLCCYDYGTGGVWIYISAKAKIEIAEQYPELTIYEEPPIFLDSEFLRIIKQKESHDLNAPATGILQKIIDNRTYIL